ncbi:hypothetical protein OF363_00595, partial [Mycoplasma enhydrae]|uniref:hypothetical protein n=1 Tax=Mycoplasma enhydrae TaxID=2499220 RepID=UPI0021E8B208
MKYQITHKDIFEIFKILTEDTQSLKINENCIVDTWENIKLLTKEQLDKILKYFINKFQFCYKENVFNLILKQSIKSKRTFLNCFGIPMQLKKDQIRYLLDQLIKQSSTLNNELWKEEIKQAANNQKIMVEDIYQDLINCNNQESWIGLLILMVSTIEVQIERLIIIGIKWKKFLSEIEENNIREDSEEWTEKYFNTIFEKDKKWQDRKFGREIFNFNWMKKLKKKYYEIYGKKLKEEDEFSKKYKYVRNALVNISPISGLPQMEDMFFIMKKYKTRIFLYKLCMRVLTGEKIP